MMKGKMLQRLIQKILMATVFLFSACDLNSLFNPDYDVPVNEFLKEYTETAGIMAMELDGSYPVNSEGITCLPCTGDRKIKFYLRNPQNYTLNVSMETDDSVNTDVTVKQDENDKSLITLLYPKEYLLNKDKDRADKNISGVIKIVEPKSGRSFSDYSVSLHANSLPPSIENAVFQLDSTDINNANYVICFYFPELNIIENGIHQDVNVLLVNGEKKYVSGTTIYSDEECKSVDTAFTTVKPDSLTSLEDSGGYQFAPDSAPDDYIPLYYKTNIKPSTDEIRYSFILQDKEGLKGNETGISNKAGQLCPPEICRTDRTALSDNENLATDENTFLYTLFITHNGKCEDDSSCGSVTINYTITETNGARVFADGTSSVLTGSSIGEISLNLPKGIYSITSTASKNFYITSEVSSVSAVKITKPAVYYISEKGFDSDSQSGSAGEPYRTIQYALNQYAAGVTSGEYELDEGCDIRVLTDLTVPADYDWTANGNYFVNTSVLTGAIVNISGWNGTKTLDITQDENSTHTILNATSGKINISNLNFTGGYTDSVASPIFNISSGVEFVIKDSKIYGNTLAADTDGDVLSLIQSGGSLKMKNVIVSDNLQHVGSAGDPMDTPSFLAIHQTGGNVTLDDCSITSSGTGHGTYWTLISSSGGTLTMNGGSIKDNTSCSAVFENGADMTINNAVINNNGDEWGDIIYNYGRLTVNGGSITNNTGGYTGLITNSNTGNATFTGTVIKNNILAYNSGTGDSFNCGAAFWNNGSLTLDECTISGNTINSVNGRGAGIFMKSEASLQIIGKNYIYDNYNNAFTPPKRDDIYLPTGSVIIVDGDISGSTIGINVPWESPDEGAPRIGAPAEFTSNYGTYNTALPGEIFITENNYSITASSSGEAAFAVSGGGLYTALDYTVNLTASSVKAVLNTAKSVTVAVSGTRKEPVGSPTDLYYNNADGKFYTDTSRLTTKAAGDNTVTFAAALYNGGTKVSDCEIAAASEAGKILVTVPAIAFEDTYTLRITSTFLGVTKDVNVDYKAVGMSGEIDAEDLTAENYDSLTKISVLSPAGMNVIANLSETKTFEGKTIILDREVELNSAFTPIGSGANGFKGTFDGEGETISGLNGQAALFSNVNGGTVKDLKVAGSTSVAGIAKEANTSAVIENCESSVTVTGSTSEEYCAGIVAVVENATIKGCVNTGTITSNFVLSATNVSYGAGGITGRVKNGGIVVDSCVNTGSVTGPNAGGITAVVQYNSTIRNACNSGNVSISASAVSGSKAGALFGLKDSHSQIDFCYYKEGCADSSLGIGGSTSDTVNECIKATQSGTNDAAISVGVTLNGTIYSADSCTVLSLLNAWVNAKNSIDELYLDWETDSNHWPKLK